MLTIDGSFGEGGGQILRSSLALAMVTGRPFRIEKIRAGRKKPGLMRQHLTAAQAAAEISGGTVEGDAIGSTALAFEPGAVAGGEYRFSIGTAGSTTLVLQTVLLPLLLTDRPSRITLEGGTHNPFAPPFDFLVKAYLPLVNRMGPTVSATLERAGFYPAGGGRIVVDVEPARELHGITLLERGNVVSRHARAAIANLTRDIAERELRVVRRRLGWDESTLEVQELKNTPGPGNIVTLELACEHVTEVFTGFGEIGRPAEAVATHAVQQCQRYLKATAPAGEYLTDQLMLPLAVAGNGSFRSTGLSRHAETHLELIRKFLDVPITAKKDSDGEFIVSCG
jgi:RNA 3'-terminal phosphate cyclase (ATP)